MQRRERLLNKSRTRAYRQRSASVQVDSRVRLRQRAQSARVKTSQPVGTNRPPSHWSRVNGRRPLARAWLIAKMSHHTKTEPLRAPAPWKWSSKDSTKSLKGFWNAGRRRRRRRRRDGGRRARRVCKQLSRQWAVGRADNRWEAALRRAARVIYWGGVGSGTVTDEKHLLRARRALPVTREREGGDDDRRQIGNDTRAG